MSLAQGFPSTFSETQGTNSVLHNLDNETKKIYNDINSFMGASGHAHTGSGSDGAPIAHATTADSATTAGSATTAAACSGNSLTATKLSTARKISGINFDGTEDITIPYSGLSGTPSATVYDTSHSFTANGYQKFNNGLILQWGSFTPYSVAAGTNVVTFPIPFPTACLSVTSTIVTPTLDQNNDKFSQIQTWDSTSFTNIINDANTGTDNTGFNWFAIGY